MRTSRYSTPGALYACALALLGAFGCRGAGPSTEELTLTRADSLAVRTRACWRVSDSLGTSAALAELRALAPDHAALDGRYDHLPGRFVRMLNDTVSTQYPVAVSPDGEYVVAVGGINWLEVLRYPGGERVYSTSELYGEVLSITVSPDSRLFATGCRDGRARVFRIPDGKQVHEFSTTWYSVYAVAFTLDGRSLISAGPDTAAYIWSLADGSLVRSLRGHEEPVISLAVAPDGRHVVTGSRDGTAKVWRIEDGALVRTLDEHESDILSMAFDPDGRRLATASQDGHVDLWSFPDGERIISLQGDDWPVAACFSPDGRLLLTAHRGWIHVRRCADGALVRVMKRSGMPIWSMTPAPDGRHLVTAGRRALGPVRSAPGVAIWRAPWE